MSWECPENKTAGFREAHVVEAQQKNVETETKERQRRRKITHDEESPCEAKKRGARANTENKFVQNCLQVER
jgi:hypothetical protein